MVILKKELRHKKTYAFFTMFPFFIDKNSSFRFDIELQRQFEDYTRLPIVD